MCINNGQTFAQTRLQEWTRICTKMTVRMDTHLQKQDSGNGQTLANCKNKTENGQTFEKKNKTGKGYKFAQTKQ